MHRQLPQKNARQYIVHKNIILSQANLHQKILVEALFILILRVLVPKPFCTEHMFTMRSIQKHLIRGRFTQTQISFKSFM